MIQGGDYTCKGGVIYNLKGVIHATSNTKGGIYNGIAIIEWERHTEVCCMTVIYNMDASTVVVNY